LCVPDSLGGDALIPPNCAWIVQYEPCGDPAEYIFRVGRISSEMNSSSNNNTNGPIHKRALLFLAPSQFGFLKYYRASSVRFREYTIPKLANVQRDVQRLVRDDYRDDYRLKNLGVDAFHAYLLAYASHEYRDIYNVHELDPKKVALSFGFERPPLPSAKSMKADGGGGGGGDNNANNSISNNNDRHSSDEEEGGQRTTSSSFQGVGRSREQMRWKPVKNERTSWMAGKKTWKHANVHARKWKVKEGSKTDLGEYKPKSVKLR